MKLAVITSCYGAYDEPAVPRPQTRDADWILVADRPYDVPPWRTIVEPRPQLHPRLAAKVAKCQPWRYTDADVTVWIDASFRIWSAELLDWCVDGLGDEAIAQIAHPQRQSILDEAAVSASMPKYAGLPVAEQARHYIEQGYPDGWGLWATGLIVQTTSPVIRHARDGALRMLGLEWLSEQVRWTYQDQLSQAPVMQRLGLRPVNLPGPLLGNPHFSIANHRSEL